MTKKQLQHEVIALRSIVALSEHDIKTKKRPKPKATPAFRQLWVLLSKTYDKWDFTIAYFKPATIIKWHKTAFSFYWFKKSKKKGRSPIKLEVINLIKKIHKENPLLSPEKIHEKLILLNIKNAPAPNTIAKYLPQTKKPPSKKQVQSWRTFLKNHAKNTWAMDFFTMPTLTFKILYVLVIINHGSRKIEHFAVTTNPNADWLKQQLRNTTPYDHKPKYIIHDNDPVFLAKSVQEFLNFSGIKAKKTSIKSPWQNPYAERVVGILRQELLNHIIPLNEKHLNNLLKEYIEDYYNTHRTHQGINGNTPIPSPTYLPTKAKNSKLKSTPVLGGLYHTYNKAS
ncbi:Mobile element protein [Candidatus Syntrophocurvum alkaliphilum]|uniref:Mobile element protein n=1 Tax=Candidatus Syntrophocurvum alkaliphilum TaxID=2293317 RepID=A0A6I6DK46_9FIRM|nr:integrase core domain-containing protein [Candidatus Syntrophocurvum alkaliphilum]QGU00427.1 Mobile element protein [Candidatus Syntrophocurvum alkaliphilum]